MPTGKASHDDFFKNRMGDIQVAADFLQAHLPTSLLKVINLKQLKSYPGTFVDKHLQALLTDKLYEVPLGDTTSFIYILVEHVRHEVVQ
jgi:predicted transposase YdaD